jgi:hypothetical protein
MALSVGLKNLPEVVNDSLNFLNQQGEIRNITGL